MNRHFVSILTYIMASKKHKLKNKVFFWLVIHLIKNRMFLNKLSHVYITWSNNIRFTSNQILFIWKTCIDTCNFINDCEESRLYILYIFRLFYFMQPKSRDVIKKYILQNINSLKEYNTLGNSKINESTGCSNIFVINSSDYLDFKNIMDDIIELDNKISKDITDYQMKLEIRNPKILNVFSELIVEDASSYSHICKLFEFDINIMHASSIILEIEFPYNNQLLITKLLDLFTANYIIMFRHFAFMAYCKLYYNTDAVSRLNLNFKLVEFLIKDRSPVKKLIFAILGMIDYHLALKYISIYCFEILKLLYYN